MKSSILGLMALSAILSVSFMGFSSSFAQSDSCVSCVRILPHELEMYMDLFPLVIWTDTHVYDHNSVVKINGHLKPQNTVSPILIVVTNPMGNIVTIEQISPDNDGDFSFTLNTASPLWKQDGDYVVKAQSGSDTRQFKTKFTLVSYDTGDSPTCNNREISVFGDDGAVYCIPFTSAKNTSLDVTGKLNVANKSLSLTIQGIDADSIVIDIPRTILDSKLSGDDSEFVVMSDGNLINFKEVARDNDSRQIKIDYSPTQSGNYDIIGTFVVPEFGSIAALILIGSMGSILLLGRSISNRFVKF